MQIAMITKNGKEPGDVIMVLSRKEAQDMNNIFTEYCEQNKKKKTAKKMLKEMDDNFCVW